MEFKQIKRVMDIIARLRAENGCPWDRKQTPKSMIVYLIEESHELLEAINAGNTDDIREELGDVLFLVLFIAHLYAETGEPTLESAAETAAVKMIRRHPHVFGDARADNPEAVKAQWQQIKKTEKPARNDQSILDAVPAGLPALMRAYRISERAARAGFDWDDIAGVMDKVEEEWGELKTALKERSRRPDDASRHEDVALEFGDILFTLTNVARFAKIHPETALSGSTRKFEARFRHMEQMAAESGRSIETVPRNELEEMWGAAKSVKTARILPEGVSPETREET